MIAADPAGRSEPTDIDAAFAIPQTVGCLDSVSGTDPANGDVKADEAAAVVLRVLNEAKESLYWVDLVARTGLPRAALAPVIAALDRGKVVESDDGEEPFHLLSKWPEMKP